jgi:hypothetical protein
MNYWDGQKWSPSEATFELAADAFVANKVQHRTRLNAELNVVGAVTTTLKDGTTLKSTPVAIALYDPNDGRFAVVSSVTNSTGILLQSNKVVYPQAFQGGVCASAVYTLEKGSFEQDIVITGGFDPGSYGFPNDCQVQIITEFYEAPRPEKRRRPIYVEKDPAVRSRKVSPDRVDEVLGFGDFVIGTGKAYTAPSENNPKGISGTVSKELLKTSDGRVFLVETVEYRSIKKGIEGLPPCGATQAAVRKDRLTELAKIAKPKTTLESKVAPSRATAEFAKLVRSTQGVTIDYYIHIGGSLNDTTVFQSDTTLLVVGDVYCNGPVVIEGGAVFKYRKFEGCGISLTIGNSLTLKTSAYQPAIFTAMDDDSVGDSALWGDPQLTGYTGQIDLGAYGTPALRFDEIPEVALRHLRFSYLQEAIRFGQGPGEFSIAHSQFVKCVRGITISGCNGGYNCSGPYLCAQNCLFSNTDYPYCDEWMDKGFYASFTHCTIDSATEVVTRWINDDAVFSSSNCIFVNCPQVSASSGVSIGGSHNGFYNSFVGQTFGTDPVVETEWPFAPVGYLDENEQEWYYVVNAQGGHYLRTGSPFVNAGGVISSLSLSNELRQMTTVVPELFNVDVNSSQTLYPRPIRDTSAGNLGYHYAAVDYVLCGTTVNNSTLNIDQGTVLAFTTPYYTQDGRNQAVNEWSPFVLPFYEWGIRLNPGGRLNVNGVPTNRVVFASLDAVQENPLFSSGWGMWCPVLTIKGLITPSNQPVMPLPEVKVRFSDFFSSPGPACHIGDLYGDYTYDLVKEIEFDGCYFSSGWFMYESTGVADRTFTIRNNIFDRTRISFDDWFDRESNEENLTAYNNLFRGGTMWLVPSAGENWTFIDNIFDHTSFDDEGYARNGPVGENHHNAYVGMGTERLSPNTQSATDKVLASLAYASGPLGNFYLPTTVTALIDTGSRLASAAGLYHFTSFANNTKEATGQVNIGSHYLSLSAGRPADFNTDGVSDFIADRNGDGVEDDDEMPWTSANNGSLAILSPVNSSILSGIVKLKIDLGELVAGTDRPSVILAKVDGKWLHDSIQVQTPAESLSELEIDTRRFTNGEHSISVLAYIRSEVGGEAEQELFVCPEIVVDVVNDVRFPAWEGMSQVAFQVDVEAQAASQNYSIWFFDGQFPTSYSPYPIDVAQGTTSGSISFRDTLSNLGYGDGSIDPSLYSITELAGQSLALMNPVTRNDPNFPEVGGWVVSYALDPVDAHYNYDKTTRSYELVSYHLDPLNNLDARWMHDMQLDGWSGCGSLSGAENSPRVAYPSGGSTAQTWPVRNNVESSYLEDTRLLDDFLMDPWTRNAYLLAHGEEKPSLPFGIRPNLVMHRYRFVFLDSCEGARGYIMKVFGATATELSLPTDPACRTLGYLSDLDYPANSGPIPISYYEDYLRPGAYLGWNVEVPIAFHLTKYNKSAPQEDPFTHLSCDYQIYCAFANWEKQVIFYWTLANKTLVEAIRDATALAYVPGTGSGDLQVFQHINMKPVRILPDRPEYYFDGPRENLMLFGHGGLKFNQWNHATDGVPTSQ